MDAVLNLSWTWAWILSIIVFIIWYYFIIRETRYKLNKSIPALFMWTGMFIIIWLYFVFHWLDVSILHEEIQTVILEVVEIFFFLFVAMTYVEVLIDRNVFEVLKQKLLKKWYDFKQLFWIIWFLAFFLSPLIDNLTTALILVTVLMTISKDNKFLIPTAINIVVAANAWGVWSPFGDITTLMAWTSWKWGFIDFLSLFPAAFIWWLVTAYCLSKFIWKGKPKTRHNIMHQRLKKWSRKIMWLWLFTIFMAVIWHQIFDIPAMWWMMFWFSLLKIYTYRLSTKWDLSMYYIDRKIKHVEVDTLLFFFWILSAVWALSFLWYFIYIIDFYTLVWSLFWNITVWIMASVVGNVPVMSSVLKSNINMWSELWMLLTLAVWIWWSLISFWSAAWIWMMWKLRWYYTFKAHMKFFPIILLGYFVSISVFIIQYYLF